MEHFIEHHYYAVLACFVSFIVIGNIPVGHLRNRYARFSRPWARCLYIPIVVNIILRRLLGFSYDIIPLVIIAVIAGQFMGARLPLRLAGIKDQDCSRPPDVSGVA